MNKYIFDETIYEDIDLFNNIKNEYNIYIQNDNINIQNILYQIYLLKIDINKQKKLIKNINIKISSIKNTFIVDTHNWTLDDSCNKNKIKKKVKHILEIHNIISQLNYDKKDIEEIIENNINDINNKVITLNNNYTHNYTEDYTEDYDELNSIINC
tara:strand:- start:406 stop:873 length:468 start_codon:yes stop_codon:yes gene_type:complete